MPYSGLDCLICAIFGLDCLIRAIFCVSERGGRGRTFRRGPRRCPRSALQFLPETGLNLTVLYVPYSLDCLIRAMFAFAKYPLLQACTLPSRSFLSSAEGVALFEEGHDVVPELVSDPDFRFGHAAESGS